MSAAVNTAPELRVPTELQQTPEAKAFTKSLSDMYGRAVVVQNIDGSGTTAVGFNPTTHKLAYWNGRSWIDL